MTTARDALCTAARALVGLTAPDPAYLDLVAPGDVEIRQRQVATESDCGLVRLGLEEQVWAVPARGPYREGSAFELVYQRAGGNPWAPSGALRVPTLDEPPGEGDGLVWGASSAAVAHVDACAVQLVVRGSTIESLVVAGGQRTPAGLETVKMLARTMRWDGRRWLDVATGRPLIGVLNADGYPFALRDEEPATPRTAGDATPPAST